MSVPNQKVSSKENGFQKFHVAVTHEERALCFLRSLPETSLHKKIIHPLLNRMASYVKYTHRGGEQGKDFIYVTKDSYGDSVLEVCQVKNQPFSGKAGKLNNTRVVLQQLRDCRTTEVTNPETNRLERPQVVSLWTTYALPEKDTVNARLLLEELRELRCKIIGPEKLLELLKTHLPDVVDHISYPGGGITTRQLIYLDQHHESAAFETNLIRSFSRLYVTVGVSQSISRGFIPTQHSSFDKTMSSIPADVFELISGLQSMLPSSMHTPELVVCNRRKTSLAIDDIDLDDADDVEKLGSSLRVQSLKAKQFAASVQKFADDAAQSNSSIQSATALKAIVLANEMFGWLIQRLQSNVCDHIEQINQFPIIELRNVTTTAILETNENIVIEGEAGSGKTSVARMIARDALEQGITCVYFPCMRITDSDTTLFNAMANFLQMVAPEESESTIRQYIKTAQLVILDGCDEAVTFKTSLAHDIAKISWKGKITKRLRKKQDREYPDIPIDLQSRFEYVRNDQVVKMREHIRKLDLERLELLNQYDSGFCTALHKMKIDLENRQPRVIVTTRSVDPLRLDSSFFRLQLQPFSNEQLLDFFTRWLEGTGKSPDELMRFLLDNHHMLEICRLPIVATLLAGIYECGIEPPNSKTELYERRFELLLDRWDRVKMVPQRNRILTRDKRNFISRLAFRMHIKHTREFSTEDVLEEWEAGFAKHYPQVQINNLMWELEVANSVVKRIDDNHFSLGHLSFQEFMTAHAIMVRQDRDILISEFHDKWWSEVLIFYAGLCGDIESLLVRLQERAKIIPDDPRLQELINEARLTSPIATDFIRDLADSELEWFYDDESS